MVRGVEGKLMEKGLLVEEMVKSLFLEEEEGVIIQVKFAREEVGEEGL